jgi:hypothetical protein
MQPNQARSPGQKRTSVGTYSLYQRNSKRDQLMMTIPKRLRDRGNFDATEGDSVEVIEVQGRDEGCWLELIPADD